MPAAKITKRIVDAAQPAAKDHFLWDTEVKGFGLKVTPRGSRTYVLQYRLPGSVRTSRFNIGKHGSPWTPDSARERARDLLQGVRRGQDPRAAVTERRRVLTESTFEKLSALFIERYAKTHQPKSWQETARIFARDVLPEFGGRAVVDIKRPEIAYFLEEKALHSPAAAKLTHAMLRKFFRWCVDRGVLEHSPMAGMGSPAKVASRERVLSDEELRLLWEASEDVGEPWTSFYRFSALTGQRREETASMRWEDLDENIWTVPAARSKNGKAHRVPLSSAAAALLSSVSSSRAKTGLIFTTTGDRPISGFSKAKRRLDLAMAQRLAANDGTEALPAWRLHDLRRTLATGLQRLGQRLEVTEAVLNHVSGSRAGIVGVYQRHDYDVEKRLALQSWSDHVQSVTSGALLSNVIPMRQQSPN